MNQINEKINEIRFESLKNFANDIQEKYLKACSDNVNLRKELNNIKDTCPHCGCNELLCGYPKCHFN